MRVWDGPKPYRLLERCHAWKHRSPTARTRQCPHRVDTSHVLFPMISPPTSLTQASPTLALPSALRSPNQNRCIVQSSPGELPCGFGTDRGAPNYSRGGHTAAPVNASPLRKYFVVVTALLYHQNPGAEDGGPLSGPVYHKTTRSTNYCLRPGPQASTH